MFRLPKAQRIQDIESLNFIKFAKPIKRIRSNFNLVLCGKRQVKHITILTSPSYKIWSFNATTAQLRPPMWRRYKKSWQNYSLYYSSIARAFRGEMDYKPWLIPFITPYFLQSQINLSCSIKAELSNDLVWHPRVKTIVFDHLGSAGFVTIAQKITKTKKHKYTNIKQLCLII